jgi:hypothetical protein
MSLLFIDGFDAYGADATPPATIVALLNSSGYMLTGGYEGQQVTSDTRTGIGCSLFCSSGLQDTRLPFPTAAGVVAGFALKFDASSLGGGALGSICSFRYNDLVGHVYTQLNLCFNNENGISLITQDADANRSPILVAASNPNVLFQNTWQYVEVLYTPGLGNAGSVVVKVDGAVVIDVAGGKTSYSGAAALVNQFTFSTGLNLGGEYAASSGMPCKFDDFYLCNTSGTAFNTFLGDCVVHSVFPNADAGTNMMAQTGGGAGHFTSVDEQSPDDDTSYLSTNQAGQKEMFSLGAFPNDMIDVLAIGVNIRVKKDAAGTGMYQACLAEGGSEVDSPDIASASNYVTSQSLYTQPPGGGVWTKASAQLAQIGFQTV